MNRASLPAALLATVVLAGCGVRAQGEPHRVDLPRHPLTGSGSPSENVTGEVAYVLCLVRDGRLVQTVRRASAYPDVRQQLVDLIAGPSATEAGNGLSTALAGLTVTASLTSGAGAKVETTQEGDGARNDEILAYGQMVCTLTARADVDTVTFTREGRPLEVPRADGTLTDEPLRAGDYAALVGPA